MKINNNDDIYENQFTYNLTTNSYSITQCNCQCTCTTSCNDCSNCTYCCKTYADKCTCCTSDNDNIIKFCPTCQKFSGNYIIMNFINNSLNSCTCKCSDCNYCIKYKSLILNMNFLESIDKNKINDFFNQVDENVIADLLWCLHHFFYNYKEAINNFHAKILPNLDLNLICDILVNIKNNNLKHIIQQSIYNIYNGLQQPDRSYKYIEFLQQMQVSYLSKLNNTIDNAIKENSKLLSNVSENTKTTATNTEKTAKNVSSVNTLVTHYVKSSNYNNYDEYYFIIFY